MLSGKSEVSLLVLSEDGTESAVPTVKELFRKMCYQAFGQVDLAHLQFQPPSPARRKMLSGNRWKSVTPEDRRDKLELIIAIANQLKRENGFVLFHFDGDRTFHDRALAENPAKFERHIIREVERHLDEPSPLAKLFAVTPYYSIEAWTYYNTSVLSQLCRDDERGLLRAWAAAPGSTEEIEKISTKLSAGKMHNFRLASESFPSRQAYEAGKSFASAVEQLRANRPLSAAICRAQREAY